MPYRISFDGADGVLHGLRSILTFAKTTRSDVVLNGPNGTIYGFNLSSNPKLLQKQTSIHISVQLHYPELLPILYQ